MITDSRSAAGGLMLLAGVPIGMRSGSQRSTWGAEPSARSLADFQEAILDCLQAVRGGDRAEHELYLDDVLARAGAGKVPAWPDLFRALTILQQDAVDEGADPRMVQEHVTRLHRILEQVDQFKA